MRRMGWIEVVASIAALALLTINLSIAVSFWTTGNFTELAKLFGGFTTLAVVIGVYQFALTQRAQRTKLAIELIDKLYSDEDLRVAWRFVDGPDRTIMVPAKYLDAEFATQPRPFKHSRKLLSEAMDADNRVSDSSGVPVLKHQDHMHGVYVRVFDRFFDYIASVYSYYVQNLVNMNDLTTIIYIMQRLDAFRTSDGRKVFEGYLQLYPHPRVTEMINLSRQFAPMFGLSAQPERTTVGIISYFETACVIHDVVGAFPDGMSDASHTGDTANAARALVAPARTVYIPEQYREAIAEQLDYYKSIGIGPKNVRFVAVAEPDFLFRCAYHDLRMRNEQLGPISLYAQSERIQRVFLEAVFGDLMCQPGTAPASAVRRLKAQSGISTLRTGGGIEGVGNNKLFLREILKQRFHDDGRIRSGLNVEFVGVSGDSSLPASGRRDEVEQLIAHSAGSVFVKTTTWDSGDYMKPCSSVAQVEQFIDATRDEYARKYPGLTPEFVVERDLRPERDIEVSAQFFVNDDGNVRFLRMCENIVRLSEDPDKIARWEGTLIVGDKDHKINKRTAIYVNALRRLMEYYAGLGYRGYAGFDLVLLKNGQLKLLELNGRITGATYPLLVFEQLAKTCPARNLCLLSIKTVKPAAAETITNFNDLRKRLENLIWNSDSREGVIPTLVTKLPNEFSVNIVAPTPEKVMKLHERMRETLKIQTTLDDNPTGWIA